MERRNKAFVALQKEWYRKLADSGFEDAEEMRGGEMELRQSAAHGFQQTERDANLTALEAKQRYYELMGQHADEHVFDRPIDEIVLTMWAQGARVIEICAGLKKLGLVPRHKETVMFIIRRYEHIWGVRRWTLKELDLHHIK
jgi:hypothetical protein